MICRKEKEHRQHLVVLQSQTYHEHLQRMPCGTVWLLATEASVDHDSERQTLVLFSALDRALLAVRRNMDTG
jgi:hypothetical protein